MARKKRRKKKEEEEHDEEESLEPRLHPETKKIILAMVSLGMAVLLVLARFNNAGPVGKFFYEWLYYFFGIGYYLLPLIFLTLSCVFLFS